MHKLVTATKEHKSLEFVCFFTDDVPSKYLNLVQFWVRNRRTSASQEQGSVLGSSVLASQSLHLQEPNTETHLIHLFKKDIFYNSLSGQRRPFHIQNRYAVSLPKCATSPTLHRLQQTDML